MTPLVMRLIGIIFMLAAASLLILNLERGANPWTFWPALPLFVIGLALVARARKARL